MNTLEALAYCQQNLKAPKGQTNQFGGYRYRSAEDILEAVKPHLLAAGAVLTLSDEVIEVGGRVYIKATATLYAIEGPAPIVVTANAREQDSRKGMDESQVTGSASSYARKYALNGLFAIDDTKDADTMDNRDQGAKRGNKPAKPDKSAAKRRFFDAAMKLEGGDKNAATALCKDLIDALGHEPTAEDYEAMAFQLETGA